MTSVPIHRGPNLAKPERQTPLYSNRKPLSSKYLHLKNKLSTMRPTKPQPPVPLTKLNNPSRKSQRVAPTIVKTTFKKNQDTKGNEDKSKDLLDSKEPKSPQQQAIILEYDAKMKANSTNQTKLPKASTTQSCPNPKLYNPKQFSSNKADEVKKPVENKKLLVEDIQKNLRKWRIQKGTKIIENQSKDYNIGDNKSNFIYTEVPKFIPEKRKCVDVGTHMYDNHLDTHGKSNKVKLIDAWTNSSDMKCSFLSVESYEKKVLQTKNNVQKELITPQPSCKTAPNKTMHHISIQVNMNGEASAQLKKDDTSGKENKLPAAVEKVVNSKNHMKDSAMIPTAHEPDYHNELKELAVDQNVNPVTEKGTGHKELIIPSSCEKLENSKHLDHAIGDLPSIGASKLQMETLPEESTVEKHKKSIYAVVDRYLNNTKTQSMDNFMKYIYMLQSIECSKTNPIESKDPFNKSYTLQPETNNTSEFTIKAIKDGDMTESKNRPETACSTTQYKEKYDKSINTERFKSKLIGHKHLSDSESYRNPLKNVTDIDHTKKEKFKTLTLVNSKQNEKMCIHINYQPHNKPITKSKLTIHKESLINIRPQLTKHTFTTATCHPQSYSSKPNISTQYLVHLDEGGCKEIKPETQEELRDKNINKHSGTMAQKKSKLDYIIRCLIRYVKLNLNLSSKMTSAVCEKLLSLQEFLCSYYSNQCGDLKFLSSSSRQIVTLILLEVDNPDGLNLNIKTNKNMKLILQSIVENLQNIQNSKNVNGPPPTEADNSNMRRPDDNSNTCNKDNPCVSNKTNSGFLHSRKKCRKSFGMKKRYLNKKIRSTLDKHPVTSNESNVPLGHNKCNCPINVMTKLKETFETVEGEKYKKTNTSELKQNNEDVEVLYESDWVTPSSSTCSTLEKSISICSNEPKSVRTQATSNVAEIKIRLRDKNDGNTKEHYRISVKTDEDSIMRGVQPELPCFVFNPNPIDENKAKMKNGEVNLALGKAISDNSTNTTGVTNVRPSKPAMKSRTNFTNNDKTFVDSVLFSLSKSDFNNSQCSHPNILKKTAEENRNNCGDNNLRPMDTNLSMKSKLNEAPPLHKVNIGVNTDASLLGNLLRRWHSDTDDSYACDLSLCFSTTDNELSEGEIGLYQTCHPVGLESSETKLKTLSSQSLRNRRMRYIQKATDYIIS